MKLKLMPSILVVMLVVLFASCSQKASVPVPEDAGLVFHLDGASLSSKLSWDEIKQGEAFKKAYEEADDSLMKTIMNDIEQTGIDVKGDLFFFLTSRGRGSYATITCGIKDEAKFKAMVAKVKKNEAIVVQDGLSIVKDNDNVLTWNSDRMVFVGDASDFNDNSIMHGEPHRYSVDSLMNFAKAIYSLEKKNSLADDKRFSSMMKEKGDAHFWMNASSMYGNSLPAMFALTKASLLFEGNASAATINFTDGQITFDAKSYYNKELSKIYEKFGEENLDESMLKKIPSQNVAAAIAIKYPPEGLKEFLTLLGVDGLLNMFLAKENYTIDDFVKANKGDILLSVSDFEVKSVEKPIDASDPTGPKTMHETPEAKIIFATTINDKASFDKLVGLITSQINKAGKVKEIASKIPTKITSDLFVAGNDSAAVHAYGTTTTDHVFISKIKGHPMGGFLDIQKFINGARTGFATDSVAVLMADESLKYWQDIIFYGGEIKDGAATSHIEVNMVDKKTNSLKQLYSFINFAAGSYYSKHKRMMDHGMERPDTLAAPKPF
jgi:hypothetical protein